MTHSVVRFILHSVSVFCTKVKDKNAVIVDMSVWARPK